MSKEDKGVTPYNRIQVKGLENKKELEQNRTKSEKIKAKL